MNRLTTHQKGGQRRAGEQRERCPLGIFCYGGSWLRVLRYEILAKSPSYHNFSLCIKARVRGRKDKLGERYFLKNRILGNKIVLSASRFILVRIWNSLGLRPKEERPPLGLLSALSGTQIRLTLDTEGKVRTSPGTMVRPKSQDKDQMEKWAGQRAQRREPESLLFMDGVREWCWIRTRSVTRNQVPICSFPCTSTWARCSHFPACTFKTEAGWAQSLVPLQLERC